MKKTLYEIGMVIRNGRPYSILLCILILSNGLIPYLNLLLMERIVTSMTEWFSGIGSIRSFVTHILLLIAVMTFGSIRELLEQLFMLKCADRLRNVYIPKLYEKMRKMDYAVYESSPMQDYISRLGNTPESTMTETIWNLLFLPKIIIEFMGYIAYLATVDFVILAVYIALSIPVAVVAYHNIISANKFTLSQTAKSRKVGYIRSLLTDRNTVNEIRIFSLYDHFKSMWLHENKALFDERMEHNAKIRKRERITKIAEILFILFVILVSSLSLRHGEITFAIFLSLITQIQEITATLTWYLPYTLLEVSGGVRYFSELYDFMHMEERKSCMISCTPDMPEFEIIFDHVSFTYPNTEHPVLSDASFTIHKSEKAALVGLNGAGKTTILKILAGLYEPTSGRATINGLDICSLDDQTKSRLWSIVFQDYCRYDMTIRENITLGKDKADDGKIRDCIHACRLENLLQNTDLDQPLGILDENGRGLSGGQYQKLAVCRAMYAETPMIVLDEPTASLDPKAEAELYHNILKTSTGKTSLLISHRLGAVSHCSKILVLDGGSIKECGSHSELMNMPDGIYRKLYETQKAWYV